MAAAMDFNELADLIRSRRTSMLVDKEREVPADLVRQLCELAQWAPNHKRTWPWRFTLVTGDSRARLGDTIADCMALRGDAPDKVLKTRGKYLRTPSVLVVGTATGDSDLRTSENRDAVACGIQNLLLGATVLGLASYWGSCATGANDAVAEFAGFDPGTHITGLIYLGWATATVAAPERPPVQVHSTR